jgi:DNA mismatch repair protein MSH6
LTEFQDDLELTKFETLIAQIRPRELILEKVCTRVVELRSVLGLADLLQGLLSSQALRLLKNNTSLTTIWNRLKPGSEFWEADTTVRDLMTKNYFENHSSEDTKGWPEALEEARMKELAMSAFGALLCYLQTV